MPHSKLVFVAGSPARDSRSARLLDAVATEVQSLGVQVSRYALHDFEPQSLLYGNVEAASIAAFIHDIEESSGIVVATPVYKGALSGALKLILDVIPPDALEGKVALAIATARQPAHLDGAGRSLSGVFEFFRVRATAAPLLLPDASLFEATDPNALREETIRATLQSGRELHALLAGRH